MDDLLNTLPFDWTRPAAQELLDILSRTYFRDAPVVRFTEQAGISLADINWSQSMIEVWHELITKARNQNRLHALLDAATEGTPAIADRVRELIGPMPVVEAPSRKGSKPIWHGFDDRAELEAQIFDQPTLLDVAFLARGTALAPAVCRLSVAMESGHYHGTAFRIGSDLLLTNHHVLFDWETSREPPATAVDAWFHYELGIDRRARIPLEIRCLPDSIVGDRADDWAVIRTDQPLPPDIPVIELDAAASVSVGDRVSIIQHPNGERKKIGIHHNVVRHVDDRVIQYWTDTEPGSSGSPVFDHDWRVVALHHAHISVPLVPDSRNEGSRIRRVVAGLAAKKVAL